MFYLYRQNIVEKFAYNSNRVCVIYNYFEKNDLYKDNFMYFLQNGIIDEVDYYIVVNGTSSIEIPERSNIVVYFRENIGYDFGAFSYIVQNKLTKSYDYYFFINTSVKGPYLKYSDKMWYEYFIDLFDENTHLVGTTINICKVPFCLDKLTDKSVNPHVQSMFFAVDYHYFSELKRDNFFNEDEINRMDLSTLIREKEIGLSQIAIKKGYNINCILPKYKDLDYTRITEDHNPTSSDGDSYYPNAYFGETIDPYEVIFLKTNRILPP
jgi:hypothetical protein